MNALNNPIRLMQLAIVTTMGAIILATPFLVYMIHHEWWTMACFGSACMIAGLVFVAGLSHDLALDLRNRRQHLPEFLRSGH